MTDPTNQQSDNKLDVLIDQVGRLTEGITEFRLATVERLDAFGEEMKRFREEMKHDNAAFREEMKHDNAAFREEMKRDNAAFREEIKQSSAEFRAELRQINVTIERQAASIEQQAKISQQQADTAERWSRIIEAMLQKQV